MIIGGIVVAVCLTGAVVRATSIGGAVVDEHADRLVRHPRTISVVAVGDWLPERRVTDAAAAAAAAAGTPARFDHVPLLDPIVPIISDANLAICHMEVPIGRPGATVGFVGRAANRRTLFSGPYEVAADLRRAGFDRCSTASNHSNDQGLAGIDATLDALDAAGLGHVGTARSPVEARPAVFDVDGVAVSHLSYARNSNTPWPKDAWRLDRLADPAAVVQDVASARAAGAEVVIVSVHVFVEMNPAPDPEDRALIGVITRDADVDLVVIHGPHVVQPLETVNGTPVFWSLGNLVSGMGEPGRGKYSDPRALDGLMAAVRFTERPDGTFAATADPILLCERRSTRVVYPGIAARAWSGLPPGARADLDACVARSTPVVAGLR